MCEKQKELAKVINGYFGADAAYLDIDVFTLASRILEAGYEKPVRCKDCKKWKCHGMPFDITKGTCHNPRFHFHHGHVIDECFMPVTNETDFCSYGERKDNA